MIDSPTGTSLRKDAPLADDDLAKRARLFLGNQRLAVLRRLDTAAHDGAVTVRGAVGSFYERQLAIACIRRVAGVRRVIDQIIVEPDSATPQRESPAEDCPWLCGKFAALVNA